MKRDLSSLLWGLAKGIIAKFAEYKASGELIQTRILYVKTEVTDFKYDKGVTGYRQSLTNIEKEEWDWRDQFGFIEEIVKCIPEYSACSAEISKLYQVNEEQAEFWVTRFVQFVIGKIIADDLDDQSLVNLIAIFLADLEKSPVGWKFTVWLRGVWLEAEQYEIENGTTLRRPNPSDIETETRFELWPVDSPIGPGIHPWGGISAILESTRRGSENQEIQHEIDVTLDGLRLFKLGSVASVRTTLSAQSILRAGTIHSPRWDYSTPYEYGLAVADLASLRIFLGKMKPLLSSAGETSLGSSPLSIALERYKDALLSRGSIESRITSAITCFEALYLKPEERTELTHRLSQRVSALLRLLGLTPLKAYSELSRAYEIRSTFIHGSPIGGNLRSSAPQLCKTIMDYARISLIVFLQLQDTMEKGVLIGKLDNSMLDENALEKIRRVFSSDLLVPGVDA